MGVLAIAVVAWLIGFKALCETAPKLDHMSDP
jgi:hypothetical protein